MTRQRILRVAVVAAVAAAFGWMVLRDEPRAPDGQASETRKELAALREELDGLRAGNQVTRAALARVATGPDRSAAAATAPRGEPAAGEPEAPAAKQRMPEPPELAAQLDGKFAAQDSDPAWSRDAARQADDALGSTLPAGTTLGRVECHASLCRVESFHVSREAFRSFVDASFLSRDRKLWNGASTSVVIESSDAGLKAVSFIVREGSEFPALELVDG
jgi:hypothetical protein